jgi:hypothetical protein
MSEVLQEFVDSRSERLRVDRAAGIIRGVKLLGLASRNGRSYLEQALSDAVGLYEGAKVNINHPKGHPLAPRDYQDRLGVVRGVEFRPGQGLFGDLHFNPKHALSEQLVWDAENAPQNVGLSHNVLARTTKSGADTVVEAITKVQSIDLVADPATTSGLYEHTSRVEEVASATSSGVAQKADSTASTPLLHGSTTPLALLTLEQLEQHRPDLVREVRRDSELKLEQAQGELAAMIERDKEARRREQILKLLQENGLPLPKSDGHLDSQLVDASFIDTLMGAKDVQSVRQLVEERARLIRSAWQWTSEHRTSHDGPRSRDQLTCASSNLVRTTREFTAAICGRQHQT